MRHVAGSSAKEFHVAPRKSPPTAPGTLFVDVEAFTACRWVPSPSSPPPTPPPSTLLRFSSVPRRHPPPRCLPPFLAGGTWLPGRRSVRPHPRYRANPLAARFLRHSTPPSPGHFPSSSLLSSLPAPVPPLHFKSKPRR